MTIQTFRTSYKRAFVDLGVKLSPKHAVPARQLNVAEKRLRIKLPKALREYYLAAGRERRLNHAFNRLLAPSEWELHGDKLVFCEENQCVVVWAVRLAPGCDDPPVFVATVVDGEPARWFPEHGHSSQFLVFMLHLQGAYGGGLPFSATASVSKHLRRTLDRNWNFAGEVNKMRAYGRRGQSVCFVKWNREWRLFAGAITKAGLSAIASQLKLAWDA